MFSFIKFVIIRPNPVKRNEIKRMLIMTLVFYKYKKKNQLRTFNQQKIMDNISFVYYIYLYGHRPKKER